MATSPVLLLVTTSRNDCPNHAQCDHCDCDRGSTTVCWSRSTTVCAPVTASSPAEFDRDVIAGACSACYMISRSAAAAVLAAAEAGRSCRSNIDQLMFSQMSRRGELQVYNADPPLCQLAGFASTIIPD